MDINEIKKELYKTKQQAKFSHYLSGVLFYTVQLNESVYQFPISTVDVIPIESKDDENKLRQYNLSTDLGATPFYNEMRGSELIRYISKAIENNKFEKVN